MILVDLNKIQYAILNKILKVLNNNKIRLVNQKKDNYPIINKKIISLINLD